MRVVISGATGNVGTSVLRSLIAEPAVTSIVAVARRTPHHPRPKTSWLPMDVSRDDPSPAFRGADALIHLAWAFHPTRDEVQTGRVNVLGTIRTVEAAIAAGVRTVIYASSVGAYSPRETDAPVTEAWPTHALPTAAYGRQKSYLERVFDTLELRHQDVRFVRMRMAFVFQRSAAAEQRRIFAGPLLPGRLVRPGLVPVLPIPRGLLLQAVHANDAAEAYRLALLGDIRGPVNIAAGPVLDAASLAGLFDARPVEVSPRLVRAAHAAAWHAHIVPAEPGLLELALSLPVMDVARARSELGWRPEISARDAVLEFLRGLRERAGGDTPALELHAGGTARWRELATGVGARD